MHNDRARKCKRKMCGKVQSAEKFILLKKKIIFLFFFFIFIFLSFHLLPFLCGVIDWGRKGIDSRYYCFLVFCFIELFFIHFLSNDLNENELNYFHAECFGVGIKLLILSLWEGSQLLRPVNLLTIYIGRGARKDDKNGRYQERRRGTLWNLKHDKCTLRRQHSTDWFILKRKVWRRNGIWVSDSLSPDCERCRCCILNSVWLHARVSHLGFWHVCVFSRKSNLASTA